MKKILYIDMDGVLVNFSSALSMLTEETLTEYDGRLDEVPGIFSLMKPVRGAVDAYKKLSEVFDTYILSTAPWENPSAWADKVKWVKEYLNPHAYKRLILSHHKNLNYGDYLIDDRIKNGTENFKGEHIHFGTLGFLDWNDVINYLLTKG